MYDIDLSTTKFDTFLYSQSLNLHEAKYEHLLSPSLFIIVGNSAASL